ncbi:hypothetical protein Gotur_005364 [Gossypium turneri]
MENRFLDKVEDNAVVRIWSEKRNEGRQKEDRGGTPLKSSLDLILTYGYDEEDRCLHFEY